MTCDKVVGPVDLAGKLVCGRCYVNVERNVIGLVMMLAAPSRAEMFAATRGELKEPDEWVHSDAS
jgi:hypothetical protein